MQGSAKILYASFDRVPAPKGASTHISQFVRGLSNYYQVTLMTPGPEAWEGETFGARHKVVAVNGGNFLRDTEIFAEAVSGAINEERFDAVHFRSIWEGTPATQLKSKFKHKTIYEVNGLPSVELQYHYPSIVKNGPLMERIRSMETAALVLADAIVVPSQVTKDFLEKRGIAGNKIRVIHNGVDTELFRPPEIESGRGGGMEIIYTGTLAPWQGVAHLIEAFKKVIRAVGPAGEPPMLKIVGRARKDWLKDIKRLTRKLKITEHVEFADAVRHREMPSVIAHAQIGVAPALATERNTRQGFCPIKVLEYMACGRAVVAPDLPAIRELARHEEEALLYKPNSMARLSDCIVRLIEDEPLRLRLGKMGRKRAEEFTWDIARAKLLELYREIGKIKNEIRL